METLQELQSVQEDLAGLYEAQDGPKKKVKKEGKNGKKDSKKAIHVLVDIFISLMTRPSGFLRNSIHCMYETIIPYMEADDLGHLLTVITTPDAEFISEMW